MKKPLSLVLALLLLGCCCGLGAAAAAVGPVRVKLNSDVAGCSAADYTKFMELQSDNVTWSFFSGAPVSVSDYAGTSTSAALTAGRTYYVTCLLEAASGCALPAADDVVVTCGSGVTVLAKQIVSTDYRTADGSFAHFTGLQISAKLTVDGNVLQRVVGRLLDIVARLRAWQPY